MAEAMAAHQEKLRIADELCKIAAQKVAKAEVQAKEYEKGKAKVAALRKELEAYQVPDPTVDEIERLEKLILELDVYHQQLLLSVTRYKTALEASFKGEAELPDLQSRSPSTMTWWKPWRRCGMSLSGQYELELEHSVRSPMRTNIFSQ